jgi:hypothetical protein
VDRVAGDGRAFVRPDQLRGIRCRYLGWRVATGLRR